MKITLDIENENIIRKSVKNRDFIKIDKKSFSSDLKDINIDADAVDGYVVSF